MKSLLFSAGLLLSTAASAVTTLEFHLTGEIYKGMDVEEMNLNLINEELKVKKARPLPDTVVCGKDHIKSWKKLMTQVKLARKILKKEIHVVPDHGYLYQFPTICYRGLSSEVPEVVESLMGTILHSDQGIQGLKYGPVKVVHESNFFENSKERLKGMLKHNPHEVKMWLNYKKSSDSVLLLSDYGAHGDGTELIATEIKRCK